MRVHSHSIEKVVLTKINEKEDKAVKPTNVEVINHTNKESQQEMSKDMLQKAVDSVNELFQIYEKELKFVFHEGLEQYFVQLVNSITEEVVREIPPKKLLDAFYEMQKLAGMIVDEKI
ncbi:flagellar protein FlaG [Ureibacillus acetophenoni]|uniref:Flagellar protein FlaG n=1 Tax=Ureibacillus acetophenoni TaxID=614649 RepID=A0A285TZG6_9BACL|nr:flagellar protein FlaG [Ureibacillus acetophenoni]SOC34972.1 flagellar protein FlaG [Ureibacillus acetophenoni]